MATEEIANGARALSGAATGRAEFEQARGVAAVARGQTAVVAALAGFENAVAAGIGGLAGMAAEEIADGARALSGGGAALAVFQQAAGIAAVACGKTTIVAGFTGLDHAIAAGIGGGALVGCRVAYASALSACGTGYAIFLEAAGIAAVFGGKVAIVAAFAGFELAIAAGIGGLAGMATQEIADSARALRGSGAGYAIFKEAAGAAAIAIDDIAVVAGLAGLELAIAAGIGRLTSQTSQEIADGAGTLRGGGTALAIFQQAAGIAAVTCGKPAIVAAFAGLERAVAAGIGRGALAGGGVAHTHALSAGRTGYAVFLEAAGIAAVAIDDIAIIAAFTGFELAIAAGIGGLAGRASQEIADTGSALIARGAGLPIYELTYRGLTGADPTWFNLTDRRAAVLVVSGAVVTSFEPLDHPVAAGRSRGGKRQVVGDAGRLGDRSEVPLDPHSVVRGFVVIERIVVVAAI